MTSSNFHNPLFPQTGRLFSHSPLITIGAQAMSDNSAEIGPEATPAIEPTTVAKAASTSVSAPVHNDVEDMEMAESTPAAASVQDQSSAPIAPALELPAQQQQQQQQQSAQPASAPLSAPSPVLASTSARNSPHPTGPTQMPVHATLHGAPTRQYLNAHVTPHLLEAMKHLATTE